MTTLIVALSLLLTGACGPPPVKACAQNSDPSQLGLCIDSLTTSVSDEQQIAVSVRIGNLSSKQAVGKVWWVLAPTGSKAPWDSALFTSKVDQHSYAVGKTADLSWNVTVALPNALYDLALIVHVVDPDGTERHVDLREAGPIRLQGPDTEPWLIRRHESVGPAVILSVSGPQPGSHGLDPFSRIMTIRNSTKRVLAFSASVQAKNVLAGWEDRWSDSMPLYLAPPTDGTIPAGSSQSISIAAAASSPMLATLPRIQFWLLVAVDGSVSDEVLLGGSQTFVATPRLFFRPAAPGPVAISSIDPPSRWIHSASQSTTVSVSNLTGNVQVVQVWWYLAALNDPRPWTHPSLNAGPAQVTLSPWSTQAISLRAGRPPVGRWELSAWVHYEVKRATFIHSDELFLVQQITVQ